MPGDMTPTPTMREECETPMSDHVRRFWELLETETVYIAVNIQRDHEDGPPHYDTSQFGSEIAKALVADARAALAEAEATGEVCPANLSKECPCDSERAVDPQCCAAGMCARDQ